MEIENFKKIKLKKARFFIAVPILLLLNAIGYLEVYKIVDNSFTFIKGIFINGMFFTLFFNICLGIFIAMKQKSFDKRISKKVISNLVEIDIILTSLFLGFSVIGVMGFLSMHI